MSAFDPTGLGSYFSTVAGSGGGNGSPNLDTFSAGGGTDFLNTTAINSDIASTIDSGLSYSVNNTLATPSFAPGSYGGNTTVNPATTPTLTTALENLLPTLANTASGILKNQFGTVPPTNPGQYYTMGPGGTVTTGTVAAGSSLPSFGGSSSNLLLLGGGALLLVFLFSEMGKK